MSGPTRLPPSDPYIDEDEDVDEGDGDIAFFDNGAAAVYDENLGDENDAMSWDQKLVRAPLFCQPRLILFYSPHPPPRNCVLKHALGVMV